MLNDYEKLRQEQLKFLDNWYNDFVIPARREKGHHNFSLDYGKIYAIRLDDLVYFVNKNGVNKLGKTGEKNVNTI